MLAVAPSNTSGLPPANTAPVAVIVPVIVGPVILLFVKVCVPVRVATVLSIAYVTVDPVALVSIPVPPVRTKVAESKSIEIDPESV